LFLTNTSALPKMSKLTGLPEKVLVGVLTAAASSGHQVLLALSSSSKTLNNLYKGNAHQLLHTANLATFPKDYDLAKILLRVESFPTIMGRRSGPIEVYCDRRSGFEQARERAGDDMEVKAFLQKPSGSF